MPSYDPNGNVLSDTAHTYTWNANGRPVTIDSATLIFDALDRLVEQTSGGVTTQTVYTPAGAKLAIMSGQAIRKAFVPLVGNSLAVYTGSGLQYYRHADWLGTSRLASTTSRTVYFDGSYAPFGEPYAKMGASANRPSPARTKTSSQISMTFPRANTIQFTDVGLRPIRVAYWPFLCCPTHKLSTVMRTPIMIRWTMSILSAFSSVPAYRKVPKEKRYGVTEAQYLKELEMLGANMMTQVMLCEATKNLETV